MSELAKKSRKKMHFSISHIFNYAILILWGLTTIFPFYWVLINSVRDSQMVFTDSFSLPKKYIWYNYVEAFNAGPDEIDLFKAYGNSLFISVIVTVCVVFFAGMASFAMTRYKLKINGVLNALVVGSLMFPVFSTIIPVFTMLLKVKLVDTPWAVIFPQIAGNLSFAMVVLMGYMRSSPVELEESAFLEGCNAFQVFSKIVMPIAKPAFATVMIFTFLWSYNDLFTQIFMIRSKSKYTVNQLLQQVGNPKVEPRYGVQCALIAMIVLPVLIVYIFLQKNIIKGLTAGAVKG